MRMTVIVAMVAMVFATGCARKATPEEAGKACQKWVAIQQAIAAQEPTEDPVEKATAEFQQRLQDLKDRQFQAIEKVGNECRDQADGGGKRQAAGIEKDCSAAMNSKAIEFAPEFKALNQQQVEAFKVAIATKEQAQAETRAQGKRDVEACTAQAVQDRVTRAKVACQLDAPTIEDFQKCR